MALEQALARLERALEDLAGSRDQLAEGLDQAIDASLRCIEGLEQALCATPASHARDLDAVAP